MFIESFAPPPRMVIFGAVDFTAALVRVAKILGYHVTVCDARPVFATTARFPTADLVEVRWPNDLLDEIGERLGPRDAVCILTHDAKFDVPAVVGSLATDVGYVGVMGSRRTHDDRTARLVEAGVDEAGLDASDVAHRSRHRAADAGGDRGVDLRRDHRPAHRTQRTVAARRRGADPPVGRVVEWGLTPRGCRGGFRWSTLRRCPTPHDRHSVRPSPP